MSCYNIHSIDWLLQCPYVCSEATLCFSFISRHFVRTPVVGVRHFRWHLVRWNFTCVTWEVTPLDVRFMRHFTSYSTSLLGRGGGGQVVSVLPFYSDDLSLNPAETYSFFLLNLFVKRTKINQKEAWASRLNNNFHHSNHVQRARNMNQTQPRKSVNIQSILLI